MGQDSSDVASQFFERDVSEDPVKSTAAASSHRRSLHRVVTSGDSMRGFHFLTPVSALSAGLVQLPPDERYHQLSFQLMGTSCLLVCFLPIH